MLIQADARSLPLADASVQCVVTSPPYFGLRDYGTASWDGGDSACDHRQPGTRASGLSTLRADGRDHTGPYEGERLLTVGYPYRDVCKRCGARRIDRQLGLETTPVEYVASMVAVFREVRRVLRGDGTLWLNLGDSYANDGKWGGRTGGKHAAGLHGTQVGRGRRTTGLKPKDLIGVPWAVAFALRDDGWYLRADNIWSKPNPMPESITDRPTKAHEYVFLLTKSARYFYDAAAIREPYSDVTLREVAAGYDGVATKDYDAAGVQDPSATKRRIIASVKGRQKAGPQPIQSIAKSDGRHQHIYDPAGRNARSVWTIATQPYPGSHFATMPEALAERCILAGSRLGDRVLDPFAGSGTVARVAISLGRRAIGCDLNGAYLRDLARERTQVTRGLPLEMEAVS